MTVLDYRDDYALVLHRTGSFLAALALVAECLRIAGGVEDSEDSLSRVTMAATDRLVTAGALSEGDRHSIQAALSYARGLGYDLARAHNVPRNGMHDELLALHAALVGVASRLGPHPGISPVVLNVLVAQPRPPAGEDTVPHRKGKAPSEPEIR